MAQRLLQLRQARDNASRTYNVAIQAPENDMTVELTDVNRQRQISQRLYIANRDWV